MMDDPYLWNLPHRRRHSSSRHTSSTPTFTEAFSVPTLRSISASEPGRCPRSSFQAVSSCESLGQVGAYRKGDPENKSSGSILQLRLPLRPHTRQQTVEHETQGPNRFCRCHSAHSGLLLLARCQPEKVQRQVTWQDGLDGLRLGKRICPILHDANPRVHVSNGESCKDRNTGLSLRSCLTTSSCHRQYIYWLISCFADDVNANARNGGVFRAIEAIGQAVSYGINAKAGNRMIPL
jgi:hypothetical protein